MNFKTLLLASALLPFHQEASAAPLNVGCLLRGNCINTEDVLAHLKEFQQIATNNVGSRAAGTPGHELSGNYIAQKLLIAGYKVELQPFTFKKFEKHSAKFLNGDTQYEENKDFNVLGYSGIGHSSSAYTAVDLALGAGNASTSGCEKEDFQNFPKGNIALIQRGTCPFIDKVLNAEAAGASGVILFNQGNSSDREELYQGTLSETESLNIPVLATSYPFTLKLMESPAQVLTMEVVADVKTHSSFNVIAETKHGDDANVIVLGAHLDSVAEGPGMNDNASGSASLLEIAIQLRESPLKNKVRFAWFSAEELGLIGSTKYVESLSAIEKARINSYVNADMVASPNYMLGVYDGDGSKFNLKGPEGSDKIESLLHGYFKELGQPSVETELSGRSDYAAFSAAGIAVGGVFTGAEGKKSEEEATLFGGEAGAAYDACYHLACDDLSNLNHDALKFNTHALAFMAVSLGQSEGLRKNDKASFNLHRKGVVFPKHFDCHGDIHAE